MQGFENLRLCGSSSPRGMRRFLTRFVWTNSTLLWRGTRIGFTVPRLELEEWIAACEPRGVGVVTVRAGEVDLSTAAGRMTASIVGAVARHESEQKSERVSRKRRELALAGKPSGSMIAFGHNADGSMNVSEAKIIRELVVRTFAGESLRSLTRWLIAEQVPTLRGGTWRVSTVRQMLTAARLSGQREWTPRRPEPGSSDGRPRRGHGMGEIVAQANWPAIGKSETARLRGPCSVTQLVELRLPVAQSGTYFPVASCGAGGAEGQ